MTRILLVDNDEFFRTMLGSMLLKLGYDVVEVSDGRQALKSHEASPVDIVITDLLMPEQEGLETIQQFQEKHPGVRIIAMSGGACHINARQFLAIASLFGADRTLVKPFPAAALLTAIEELKSKE
jgi:CheY-like chemotaxis protein